MNLTQSRLNKLLEKQIVEAEVLTKKLETLSSIEVPTIATSTFSYAKIMKIKGEDVVVGVSSHYEKIDHLDMIEIEEVNENLLWTIYQNGEFLPTIQYAQLDDMGIVTDIMILQQGQKEPRNWKNVVKLEDETMRLNTVVGAKLTNNSPASISHNNSYEERLVQIEGNLVHITSLLESAIKG